MKVRRDWWRCLLILIEHRKVRNLVTDILVREAGKDEEMSFKSALVIAI